MSQRRSFVMVTMIVVTTVMKIYQTVVYERVECLNLNVTTHPVVYPGHISVTETMTVVMLRMNTREKAVPTLPVGQRISGKLNI